MSDAGVVVFDADEFRQKYPAYAALTDAELQNAFENAELLADNTPASCIPVKQLNVRKRLLYLATAHYLELAQRGASAVGNVGSAIQGSVSVGLGLASNSDTPDFWAQTNHGMFFWRACLPYRKGPLFINPKAKRHF